VSIQRQFGQDWLVSVNYLGNNTFHLVTADELNPALFFGTGSCTLNGQTFADCGTTATNNQQRLLNLQNLGQYFGIVSQGAPFGTGSYNSLDLSVQKAPQQGHHCASELHLVALHQRRMERSAGEQLRVVGNARQPPV
jgi:hypothetical protein